MILTNYNWGKYSESVPSYKFLWVICLPMRVAHIDFDLANFALTRVIEINNANENEGKWSKIGQCFVPTINDFLL